MVRSLTGVRAAEPQDAARVHALWTAALADLPSADCSSRSITQERLQQQLSRPGVHTVVAHQDDRVVGLMVATTSALSPLSDAVCVTIEVLYVDPPSRGRGVGKLLLGRAALLAEQVGASQVASNVPGPARDVNRFFARLGFTSTVVRRTCTPAVLRTRLGGEDPRPLERVLARRRSLRARTGTTQPLPVVSATGTDGR